MTSGAGSEVKQLKKVASVLQESQRALSRTNALTFADLVAISGAEAIEAIGGPEMTVQLGRTDSTLATRGGAASGETTKTKLGGDGVLPIDWNNPEPRAVLAAFDRAGLTDRETASMLGVLLTLEKARCAPRRFAVSALARVTTPRALFSHPRVPRPQSDKTADNDLLESGKGKVKKLGQMGRALSDKELRGAAGFSYEAEGTEDPDVDKMVGDLDDFLIVDNFGTRDQKYGKKVKSGVDTKTFNKEFKELYSKYKADPKCASRQRDARQRLAPHLTFSSRQVHWRQLDRSGAARHAWHAHGRAKVCGDERAIFERPGQVVRPHDAARCRLHWRQIRRAPVRPREGEAPEILKSRCNRHGASFCPCVVRVGARARGREGARARSRIYVVTRTGSDITTPTPRCEVRFCPVSRPRD